MKTESCDGKDGLACGDENRGEGGPQGRTFLQPEGCSPGAGVKRHAPESVEFEAVEPWPEAVDGAELLDGLVRELERFVVFSKWVAETFALWILHTYAFRLREVTSYIGIESPEKECGKSTLLTVLSHFVDRAAVSSNISSSAFFRAIEELQPTLLIDEADTNLRGKDDLTGILNSLLLDICLVFIATAKKRLFSRDLVGGLAGCGDRPWADLLKGKAPTETWLAQQLRPYGIRSKTMRIGEKLAKGYLQEDFMETFRRYIPKSAVEELKAELAERTVIAEEAKTSGQEEGPAEPGQQPEQEQAEAAPTPEVETKPKTEQVAGEDNSDPVRLCSRTDIDNPTRKQH